MIILEKTTKCTTYVKIDLKSPKKWRNFYPFEKNIFLIPKHSVILHNTTKHNET